MTNFLIYGLSPQWGGVESIVTNIANILSKDCQIDILLSGNFIDLRYQSLGKNIRILPITAWGDNRKFFREELKNIYQNKNYDYVWINSCIMSNIDIISITRNYSNAKIISHSHGSNFESSNIVKSLILRLLHYLNRKQYLQNVDYPCMCSRVSGEWFYGKKYLNSHRVFFFKNGIDFYKYKYSSVVRAELRNRFHIDNEIVLLHVGRLTKVKNQIRLINILKDGLKEGLKLKMLIVGDGELEQNLKIKTKELGLDENVIFIGHMTDVSAMYQISDMFLLPSFHEGFPVTLIEAQCSGLPCLVSDRITREANISGLVEYLPIDSPENTPWINAIKSNLIISKHREVKATEILKNRYDLYSIAEDFKEFINL